MGNVARSVVGMGFGRTQRTQFWPPFPLSEFHIIQFVPPTGSSATQTLTFWVRIGSGVGPPSRGEMTPAPHHILYNDPGTNTVSGGMDQAEALFTRPAKPAAEPL